MRGEQASSRQPGCADARRCPREAQAVERARAAADFVEDHQAARRGVVQNVRGLAHLHHERGLPARQIVAGADAGEDAVHQIDARVLRRDE